MQYIPIHVTNILPTPVQQCIKLITTSWHTLMWSRLLGFFSHWFGLCFFYNEEQERTWMMFMKSSFRLGIALFIVSQMRISLGKQDCLCKITRPALQCYRCVTETEEYTNITNIPSHICTYQCMQRHGCPIVTHNTRQNTCSLSKDGCLELQRGDSFQVIIFGTIYYSECLQWQPPSPL